MVYEYRCIKCRRKFEVVKSMRDFDRNEFCEPCGAPGEFVFNPRVQIMGASVQHAEYNPGLGAVTKNKRDRAEQAKRKGVIEVGSDFKSGDSMQKSFDTDRAKKLAKRWEED